LLREQTKPSGWADNHSSAVWSVTRKKLCLTSFSLYSPRQRTQRGHPEGGRWGLTPQRHALSAPLPYGMRQAVL